MQAILAVRLVLEEMLLDSMVLHPMQARLWHCMHRHVVAFQSWPDGCTRLQRTHGLLLPLYRARRPCAVASRACFDTEGIWVAPSLVPSMSSQRICMMPGCLMRQVLGNRCGS